MSTSKSTIILAIAALSWFVESVDKSANAQISLQLGAPSYYGNQPNYGNQPVYRSNRVVIPPVYSQPRYRSSQTYVQPAPGSYVVTPQYGNGYREYRAPYSNGTTYRSYRPTYSNPPIYNNGYSTVVPNDYYYSTPSQQRGAIIGGAIGNAVGGNSGANIGAAIGSAVRGQ